MKRVICAALITLALPGLVHADGRYQMLPLGDQMGIGAEKIVILDTVSGHIWTWTEHAADPRSKRWPLPYLPRPSHAEDAGRRRGPKRRVGRAAQPCPLKLNLFPAVLPRGP